MYEPYPGQTQLPETTRPPVPESVRNAVRAMYVGAVTSVLGIGIDIVTINATRRALARRSPHMTASQLSSTQHVLVIAFIVGGLIGAAAWIFLARACQRGESWARITGTVLFVIATLDTLAGLSTPISGGVKLWAILVWLVGLAAIIFLWRRTSTAFFRREPA